MKNRTTVQLISVFTDLVIALGGGLITAMTATGNASFPNKAAILVIVLTSVVSAARTVQQMAKAALETEQAAAGASNTVITHPVNTPPVEVQ